CNKRFDSTRATTSTTLYQPLHQLIAEGNIGLIHAAREYDPACGFRFLPYAIYWIKQSINEAISRN
ncbi:MAG: RNA polymerase subunit sigma, partial [Duncaniella sp.]|nr:RNA polymerase subunit sigma [Duncaniella sp.]